MPDARQAGDLAILIADGATPDWEKALESATDERERRLIGHLRVLDSVARYHRAAVGRPEVDSERALGGEPPVPGSAPGSMAVTSGAASPRGSAVVAEDRWGHLELREHLGGGAFGDVYRAWDPSLDREVALKLLKREVSSDPTLAPRIVDEGRMLAKLRHSHVVTVFGAEVHAGRIGVWMELIRGRSLEQHLRMQGTLGAREAALVGIDVCRALAATHRAGVLHRDVKAQNVMREEGGRILLTDFGAGVEASAEGDASRQPTAGTPLYMAPELFAGEPASPRSDLYSVGVLLHHLVTGGYPVEGSSWEEIQARHAFPGPRLLRDERPDLPDTFVRVVERATAASPGARFATAGQMEQALALSIGSASDTVVREGAAAVATAGTVASAAAAPLTPVAPVAASPRRRRSLQLVFAIGLPLVAIAIAWALARRGGPPDRGEVRPAPPAAGTDAARATPGSPTAEYTVEAALYRTRGASGAREKLTPGARLSLGDRLNLELRGSAPLHVYVINEDDAGHAFALFPLPGIEPRNPLAPGETHVLPGTRDGKALSWTVDTPGGHEHLLVLASRARLVEFEAEMSALARPGDAAVPIPEAARLRLRGMGGLSETQAKTPDGPGARLFEMAERLAERAEVVNGVWLRRIDFENPRP